MRAAAMVRTERMVVVVPPEVGGRPAGLPCVAGDPSTVDIAGGLLWALMRRKDEQGGMAGRARERA